MTNIVITGAARTPVGSFNGAFGDIPAHNLGAVAIKAALQRSKIEAADVDEVILGQILQAAQGQNPARQAAMKAGARAGLSHDGVRRLRRFLKIAQMKVGRARKILCEICKICAICG